MSVEPEGGESASAVPGTRPSPLVRANPWRKVRAGRVAFLVDSAAYFAAAKFAISRARRQVLLLGWGFDPRTRLTPRAEDAGEIGTLLRWLATRRPELDVRVLIWKSALPISASQHFFPHRARRWFRASSVRFRLDASVPYGACHHQKVLVVDDAVAFCGGADFGVDRWDTPAHLDDEPGRANPGGGRHPPRHEVMMMMDGPAAQALGDLARTRWTRADGQTPAPSAQDAGPDLRSSLWPEGLDADLHDVEVAIARTEPAWRGRAEIREVEALHLESIRQARRSIYLENQYFASPVVAEALAARLAEPDGPDVALISSLHSPSYFDRLTMDRARSDLIARLRAADVYGRFRAYCPLTAGGRPIVVHSKVAVIDERIARVGSGNLNNRSGGFDTECDVAVETRSSREEAAVSGFRARLVGHFAGVEADKAQAFIAERGLAKGMDALAAAGGGRLSPLRATEMGPVARLIATYHLGDPCDPADSWRPGRRRRRLRAQMSLLLAAPSGAAGDPEVDR